jgi:hypothetical protein
MKSLGKNQNSLQTPAEQTMNRKDAIVKASKYALFTAAAMLIILDPSDSSAKEKSKAQKPKNRPGTGVKPG